MLGSLIEFDPSTQWIEHNGYKYREEKRNIRCIRVGDTILHQGKTMTVSKKDIRSSIGISRTIFGDSYHLGYKPVILVIFYNPLKDSPC
jgi:hypothetical protein